MILVTGGTGYIGSHTCVELARAGFEIVVLDNLANSSGDVVGRLEELTGKPTVFYEGDVRDAALLARIFAEREVTGVIHFAGLKSLSDSLREPLSYYSSNVAGTVAVLEAMQVAGCRTFIFSSSATVYGALQVMPVNEASVCAPITAYGRTKFHVEQMLSDLQASDPTWGIASLRYFNPVGAHESGLIGERPLGTPANLVPYLAQVATGKRPALKIYGRDYETRDGTGIRDYVHVVDLAKGHVAALQYLARSRGHLVVNLGTGQGTSVLEMVNAFERASKKKIPCEFTDRRSGDVDVCVADVGRARDLLGWSAEHDIDRMCIDAWRWQSMIDA